MKLPALSSLRTLDLAVRCAFKVVKARDLLSKGHSRQAMQTLDSALSGLPSTANTIDCNLLRSQIAIQVQNGPLALASAETALARLEGGEGRYKAEDRNYLIEYARALIHYCETWRDQQPAPSTVNMALVRLARVSKHLRQDFPLTEHGTFGSPPAAG
jgi:hypothetical protein